MQRIFGDHGDGDCGLAEQKTDSSDVENELMKPRRLEPILGLGLADRGGAAR
jgi:hypothetical protein